MSYSVLRCERSHHRVYPSFGDDTLEAPIMQPSPIRVFIVLDSKL